MNKRCIVLDEMHLEDPTSKRVYDVNGWFEVKDNPISKVGVFSYLGSSLGIPGVDPKKVYFVYRPAESLADQEFLDSLKLLPWIDDHTMLGGNHKPAEEKGVEGVIGESVYFEGDTVYANVKTFSEDMKNKIASGKKELSLGYTALYDPTAGFFGDQKYDFIQREIRGNHLALVDKGRMGSEVAVLDEQLSLNLKEKGEHMATKAQKKLANKLAATRGIGFDEALTLVTSAEDIKPLEDECTPMSVLTGVGFDADDFRGMIGDAVTACMDSMDIPKMVQDAVTSAIEANTEDGCGERGEGQDAALKQEVADLKGQVDALTAVNTEQQAKVDLEAKTALVGELSAHVGTFDHDDMSLLQVAQYGNEKLKLVAPEGAEIAVLNTYLTATKTDEPRFSVEDKEDGKPAQGEPSAVTNFLSTANKH